MGRSSTAYFCLTSSSKFQNIVVSEGKGYSVWGEGGAGISEILKIVSVGGSTKFFRSINIQKRNSSFQNTSNIPC